MAQRLRWHGLGHRVVAVAVAAAASVGARSQALSRSPPELSSPSIAGASNVYVETVSGATGLCSSGWFTSAALRPPGVSATQITLVGGGGGGSVASGVSATGGAGGGGAQVSATIPEADLPVGIGALHTSRLRWRRRLQLERHPAGGGRGRRRVQSTPAPSTTTGSGGREARRRATTPVGVAGGERTVRGALRPRPIAAEATIIAVAGGGGGAAGAVSRAPRPRRVTGSAGGQRPRPHRRRWKRVTDGCAGTGGSRDRARGAGWHGSAPGSGGSGALAGIPGGGNGGSASAEVATGGNRNAAGGGGGGGLFGGGGGAAGQSAGTNLGVGHRWRGGLVRVEQGFGGAPPSPPSRRRG